MSDEVLQLRLKSCSSEIASVIDRVELFIKKLHINLSETRQILLIIEELISNVMIHSYAGCQDKFIDLCCQIKNNTIFELKISDTGNTIGLLNGYHSLSLKQIMQSNLAHHLGYGLKLVYQLTDNVYFFHDMSGMNHVMVSKRVHSS